MLDKGTLEGKIITRRAFIIGAGKVGLLVLLACRLFYMQFIKKDEYKTLSDKNRISIILIPPARGQIYDAKNIIIARNQPCLKLFLDKNGNPEYPDEVLLISKILELDEDQVSEVNARIKKGGRKIPVMIIDYLDWQQVAVIEEKKHELISIFIDTGYARAYPLGKAASHLLGYMAKPQKQQKNSGITDENFKVGRSGVEEYYDDYLRGEFGHKQIEVNAFGKYVRGLARSDSIAGSDLKLHIDSTLQNKVMPMLSTQGASAIVMDCANGAVLSLSSSPGFDPNNFENLSAKYWQSLIDNPYKPLINKTIHSMYPPGSIFKVITFLAALAQGFDPNIKFTCAGQSMLGGNSFRCASRRGHGTINMLEAIKFSCNIYVFEIAKIIGAVPIMEMAKKFGFGVKTGIDLKGEQCGFVPSMDWKKERHSTRWTIGDTLNLAIGQGFLLSTPLQIARFITAIASNGKLFTPKINQNRKTEFSSINIREEYLNFIKQGFYEVVNSPGGTGYYSRLNTDGIKMAGKTGTSQVQAKLNADDDLSRANIAWHRRNHAIFAGYAPFEKPKYSVSVYYDHGGGGGKNAAPIARDIMHEVLGG